MFLRNAGMNRFIIPLAVFCLRLAFIVVLVMVGGAGRQTSLHLAVRYAALPAVRLLASYGADINAVDGTGMTALHMASGILHRDIIASLIRQGADVNKVSVDPSI